MNEEIKDTQTDQTSRYLFNDYKKYFCTIENKENYFVIVNCNWSAKEGII